MILLVLIALVARVDAAPGGAPVDLAIRGADALLGAALGAGSPAVIDEDGDEDGDEEAEDRAAERAAMDDREDERQDEESAGGGQPADRELAALTGWIARAAESLLGDGGDAGGPAGLALDDGAAGESANPVLGGDDAGVPAGLALVEDDATEAWSAGPGPLAMLDAELAPGDATAGLDAADAAATAGAEEIYEQWMRHRRPSPWGRLDVGVSWRRRWSRPIHTPARRYDEIWLVATWRR